MQEYNFKWEYWMMYILAKEALFYTPPAKQSQSWLTHWSLQGGEEHRLHEYNSDFMETNQLQLMCWREWQRLPSQKHHLH